MCVRVVPEDEYDSEDEEDEEERERLQQARARLASMAKLEITHSTSSGEFTAVTPPPHPNA